MSLQSTPSSDFSYGGYIVDIWGVLHNGQTPFPGALRFLKALKKAGKKIVLLSNAPRRVTPTQKKLREMGIDSSCYDVLMTSGEHCYLSLRDRPDAWYKALGKKFYHSGSIQDDSVYAGLDFERVENWDQAHFILTTGPQALSYLNDKDLYAKQEEEWIREGLKRHLPMICVNPDLVAPFGTETIVCAGTIAQLYAEQGGIVRFHGKPYSDIYEWVFSAVLQLPYDRVLAIGDSLVTDIQGARTMGIDSLWILSGIYAQELQAEGIAVSMPFDSSAKSLVESSDLQKLSNFCEKKGIQPNYVQHFLEWI